MTGETEEGVSRERSHADCFFCACMHVAERSKCGEGTRRNAEKSRKGPAEVTRKEEKKLPLWKSGSIGYLPPDSDLLCNASVPIIFDTGRCPADASSLKFFFIKVCTPPQNQSNPRRWSESKYLRQTSVKSRLSAENKWHHSPWHLPLVTPAGPHISYCIRRLRPKSGRTNLRGWGVSLAYACPRHRSRHRLRGHLLEYLAVCHTTTTTNTQRATLIAERNRDPERTPRRRSLR